MADTRSPATVPSRPPSSSSAASLGRAPGTAQDRVVVRWLMAGSLVTLLATAAGSWWANRAGGAGAVPTDFGQLSGLGSALFALATVLLMARVPTIERALGADRGLRWHRWAATATVILLVVHVVAIAAGYAAADRAGLGHEIAALVTRYPDMLTATVATVLLLAISLSSIRALRRRLRYETWLFGHWYAYPAVALAFGHELSTGASFANASGPTLVWTWLHVVVLVTVVWYRLVLPGRSMAAHPLRVSTVRPEARGVVSISLAGRGLDRYGARAGQSVRVRFLTDRGWWQSHPYSLSAAPTDSQWRITVAAAGDHSTALQQVRVGTKVVASGASGDLTADARLSDRVALIAGGSGVAPLRALLEDLPGTVDVRFVYRARDTASVPLWPEVDELMAQRGRTVDYAVGPRHPDPAHDVLSAAALAGAVPDLVRRDVYVCGTKGFVETVLASLRALAVPVTHIHTERFDP